MRMVPDVATLCLAPGGGPGKAYVFADAFHLGRPAMDGLAAPCAEAPCSISTASAAGGRWWRRKLEFYLTAPNPDPDRPLTAPVGRNGRAETVQHPYDMAALEEFEPVIAAHL